MIIILVCIIVVIIITTALLLKKKSGSSKYSTSILLPYSNLDCVSLDFEYNSTYLNAMDMTSILADRIPSSLEIKLFEIDVAYANLINLLAVQTFSTVEMSANLMAEIDYSFSYKSDLDLLYLTTQKYRTTLQRHIGTVDVPTQNNADSTSYLFEGGYNNPAYANFDVDKLENTIVEKWPLYNIKKESGNYYIDNIIHDYGFVSLYATTLYDVLFYPIGYNSCAYLVENEDQIKEAIGEINYLVEDVAGTFTMLKERTDQLPKKLGELDRRYFQ